MAPNSTIHIRIIGGIRAALEADTVADAMHNLGAKATRVERVAARTTFALRAMNRQLSRTFSVANLAAAGMWIFAAATTVAKIAALGLASIVLPALVIALLHAAGAVGVLGATLAGGMLAAFLAVGLVVAGVIDRFKLMSSVAGSAANDLAAQAGMLHGAFRDAVSPGADAVLRGLAAGMAALVPVMAQLGPAFTAIGQAIGTGVRDLFTQLAANGPLISKAFMALAPAVTAGAHVLGDFLTMLLQVAAVGAPLLTSALQWLSGVMQGVSLAFDSGTLKRASGTLRGIADTVRTFFSAFAKPLKPIFGPAIADVGQATKTLAGPLGTVLGTIVATFMRIGVAVLPLVVKGVQWLSKALPVALAWLSKTGRSVIAALKPAMPFVTNVLLPLLAGIGKGLWSALSGVGKLVAVALVALGWLGSKLGWAKGLFNAIGQVIGFVFAGGLLKVVGAIVEGVLPAVGWLGKAIGAVGGFAHHLGRTLSKVVTAIGEKFGAIPKFIAGAAAAIGVAASTMWDGLTSALTGVALTIKKTFASILNWVIDKINHLVDLYNGSVGRVVRHFGLPKVGHIPHIDVGESISGGGPAGPAAGPTATPSAGVPATSVPGATPPASLRPADATPDRTARSANSALGHGVTSTSQRGSGRVGDIHMDGRKVGELLDRRRGDEDDRR